MDRLVWKAPASWRFGNRMLHRNMADQAWAISPQPLYTCFSVFCGGCRVHFCHMATALSDTVGIRCQRPVYGDAHPQRRPPGSTTERSSSSVVWLISCENCAGCDRGKSMDFNSSSQVPHCLISPCQQPLTMEWKRSFSVRPSVISQFCRIFLRYYPFIQKNCPMLDVEQG